MRKLRTILIEDDHFKRDQQLYDDRTISVKHRQHIGMVKHTNSCKHLKHYNLKHACPAMYGLKAKRVLDDGGLPSGRSMHREILSFGLDGEDHNNIN